MKNLIFLLLICLESNYFIIKVKSLGKENILGSAEAEEDQFKYQVAVLENGILICGGGILDDYSIITAAHCVFDPQTQEFTKGIITVITSALDLHYPTEDVTEYLVIKIYILASYYEKIDGDNRKNHTEGDIAILKVNSLELENNDRLSKLHIHQEFNSYENETFVIAGHGCNLAVVYNDSDTGENKDYAFSDGILRFGESKYVSNEECNKVIRVPIQDSHMCARMVLRGKDLPYGTCDGDSGSPLVYKDNYIIGILSLSPVGCGEAVVPSIYTRVSSYWTFINNALKNNETSDMRIATFAKLNSVFLDQYGYIEKEMFSNE